MTDHVNFQSGTLATPPPATTIATDYKPVGGGGSAHFQRVVLDIGPDGTTIPLAWGGTGLPLGTLPGGSVGIVGTTQALGTVQPLAGSVHLASGLPGTVQVLGSVQPVGTVQALGTIQAHGTTQALGTVVARGDVASGAADSGNPVKVGGKYNATLPTLTDGQRGDAQLTSRGELIMAAQDVVSNPNNINTADSASSSTTGEDNQTIITGNATNNSTVTATGSGNSSFAVLVTGTWVGTLQFERSLDNGTTWTPVAAFSAGTAFTQATITGNGAFHGNASAATSIRVRATAWTSGVASVRILLGAGTGTVTVGNPLRLVGGDFTNIATIKAASTAPGATDTALVVALSPNGTAAIGSVAGTVQVLGTVRALVDAGTVQTLGTFQPHGTGQILGTVRSLIDAGTVQALGTVQPLAGSVHPAAALPGTSHITGTVRALPPTGTALGETYFSTIVTGAQSAVTYVAAPGAGTFIRVYDILISGSAAGTARLLDNAEGTAIGHIHAAANGGWSFNSSRGVRTRTDNRLLAFSCSAGTWGVLINYALET